MLIRGSRIQDQLNEQIKIEDNKRLLIETFDLSEAFVEDREDINDLILEFYALDEGILDKGITGAGKLKLLANKAMQKLKDSQPVQNFSNRASTVLSKYKEKFGNNHPATKAAEEIAQHGAKHPERSAFVTTMLNGLVSMFGRPDADEAVAKALGNTQDAIQQDTQADNKADAEREVAKTQGDPETNTGGVSSGNTKYPTLRSNIDQMNTKKRQRATAPVQIQNYSIVPSVPSKMIEFKISVKSADTQYETVVQFSGINYSDGQSGDTKSFVGADGEEYNIKPIVLKDKNVKVKCNCLDFYHRFAPYNNKDGSLKGDYVPYVPTTDRPSDNPKKLPGVCKHLIKSIESIKRAGLIS